MIYKEEGMSHKNKKLLLLTITFVLLLCGCISYLFFKSNSEFGKIGITETIQPTLPSLTPTPSRTPNPTPTVSASLKLSIEELMNSYNNMATNKEKQEKFAESLKGETVHWIVRINKTDSTDQSILISIPNTGTNSVRLYGIGSGRTRLLNNGQVIEFTGKITEFFDYFGVNIFMADVKLFGIPEQPVVENNRPVNLDYFADQYKKLISDSEINAFYRTIQWIDVKGSGKIVEQLIKVNDDTVVVSAGDYLVFLDKVDKNLVKKLKDKQYISFTGRIKKAEWLIIQLVFTLDNVIIENP